MTNLDAATARVRALLAKAERTDNPHEAEAFFAKATELMDKYRIDRAMFGTADHTMTHSKYILKGTKYQRASFALLDGVARHYGVVMMSAASGNTAAPTLVGGKLGTHQRPRRPS